MSLWKKNVLSAINLSISASAVLNEGMYASWIWGSRIVRYAGRGLKRVKREFLNRKTADVIGEHRVSSACPFSHSQYRKIRMVYWIYYATDEALPA
jgi:hypothetical protein